MPKSETTESTRKAEENFKRYCALKGRTETTTRLADVLMGEYITELVEGVFSEVRPNTDLLREDLRDQLDRSLAENPARETRIKQRISDLYDDVTGPRSAYSGDEDSDKQWKEEVYESTLDQICAETYSTH